MEFTDLIFYGGLAACIGYLIYIFQMQHTKSEERNDNIAFAWDFYNDAKQDCAKTKKQLIAEIAYAFGNDIADKVDKGIIYIGMPSYLLAIAKGIRLDEQTIVTQNVRIEKWYYERYKNRLGNIKYGLEVTLIDDKISSWRNLDVGTSSYRV
jgi:hypothetical protein